MAEASAALTPEQSDKKTARRKPGQRGTDVTGHEVADMLRWHKQGLTQQQIAAKFDPPKSQSTVSEILARFGDDRTEEAKAILRSGAADMALNITRNGKPKEHVAALKGLSVLQEERSAGLTIQIGIKDSDVQIALSPGEGPPLERRSAESLAIEAGSDKARSVNQG